MKNVIKSISGLIIISIVLMACRQHVEPHVHTYSDKWTSTETEHWHAATCEHSNEVSSKAKHTFGEWNVIEDSTEETEGSKERLCKVCKYKDTAVIEKKEHTHKFTEGNWSKDDNNHWIKCNKCNEISQSSAHDWNEGEITAAATCTTAGNKKYTCKVCAAEKNEEIAATGHAYSDKWTSNETEHWHAASCGHSVVSDKAAHDWNNGEVTKVTGCTTTGNKKYTCKVCDATKNEDIAATGHTYSDKWTTSETEHWHTATCGHSVVSDKAVHDWNNGEVTKAAGCTTTGNRKYTCKVCAAEKNEDIAATGHNFATAWTKDETNHWHAASCGHSVVSDKAAHDWDEGTVTKAAGCTTTGNRKYTCKVCKAEKNEDIAVTGHTYSDKWTSNETEHWHAATCGHSVVSDKAVHDWNNGEIKKAAGCTTTGTKTYTCTVCKATKNEDIAATGHTYSDKWTTSDTEHWHTASCGHSVISDKAVHDWNNGEITKAAGCTTTGTKTYTCTVCKATKNEDIVATGHTFSENWTTDENYHWHGTTCGHEEITDKHEHTWDAGNLITDKGSAKKRNVCTECQKIKDIQLIGDKITPDSIGDIILKDGSVCSYNNISGLTDEQKTMVEAVVYYCGYTGANNEASNMNEIALGNRILALNITDFGYQLTWAQENSDGFKKKWDELICNKLTSIPEDETYYTYKYSGTNYYITGDFDGSDNWHIISEQDPDNTTSTMAQYKYPAFNYVNTVLGSEYYIPTLVELRELYLNITEVNSVMTSLGKSTLNKYFLASNQNPKNYYYVWIVYESNGNVSEGYKTSQNQLYVCGIKSINK